ncbi:SDR family NAD(P)-dependent oxidoreductase, partial [Mycobacterium szulgai]|uniref:SDR family NAD(P)-dependent oxidoreductase n=1 Tax=Mycobacterium szulgai TaxID=1787 RepID=UPI00111C72B5
MDLPTYPFQHHRYWLEPAVRADVGDPAETALWAAVDGDAVDDVARVLGIDDAQSLASLEPVVRALHEWRKSLRDRSIVYDLRYQIDWQSVIPNTFPQTRQHWLVLARPEQSDDVWLTGLSAHAPGGFTVLAIKPEEFDRKSLATLLSDETTQHQYHGVVSFMALHDETHPDPTGLPAALLSTLRVAHAYMDSGIALPLWVATHGAVQVDHSDAVAPDQAAIWGLGQSICLEHPDWWGGLIDLPANPTSRDFKLLQAVLTCPQIEDQLALRAHGLTARRLQKATLPTGRAHVWKPLGTAVVTGVTGHLGQSIARWLAQAGATHLLLLSRTAAEQPGVAELEKELNAADIATTSVSVDVTDRSALAAVLAQTRMEHGPIHTVVHAAAHIGWSTVAETSVDEFKKTYAAKAIGAENLIALLEDEPPQTFIMFSSAAATWGGTRQGAYAAANAHIAALTTQLRGRGCHAVAPAWGAWSDDMGAPQGLAENAGRQQVMDYFGRIGLKPLSPDTAFAALQQSLDVDDTQITIADVDWDRFRDLFTTTRRSHQLLSGLEPAPIATSKAHSTQAHEHLSAQLAGQSSAQQLATLFDMVTGATAAVLAHPDASALDPDQPFKDLGIDSLSALELRNTMAQHAGLTLPATLIFDHPTPTALTHYL